MTAASVRVGGAAWAGSKRMFSSTPGKGGIQGSCLAAGPCAPTSRPTRQHCLHASPRRPSTTPPAPPTSQDTSRSSDSGRTTLLPDSRHTPRRWRGMDGGSGWRMRVGCISGWFSSRKSSSAPSLTRFRRRSKRVRLRDSSLSQGGGRSKPKQVSRDHDVCSELGRSPSRQVVRAHTCGHPHERMPSALTALTAGRHLWAPA